MRKGKIVLIIGSQDGDEGKGKIVDWCGVHREEPDIFARWQGGNNAGHTVVTGGEEFKLHYISAGVVNAKDILLGHDMVIHPPTMIEQEVNPLKKRTKWNPDDQLFISDRAHVTFDQHIVEDGIVRVRQGKFGADSTLRGISPTYADKAMRFGIRFCDLLDRSVLRDRLKIMFEHKKPFFESCTEDDFKSIKATLIRRYGDAGARIFENGRTLDAKAVADRYHEIGVQLEKNICDTNLKIHRAYNAGSVIIGEGAQGVGLGVTQGIYPFGTSSHPTSGGACVGLGINPKMVDHTIGIVKVFTSRVGGGPVITELVNDPDLNISPETQDEIAKAGNEFGTTTGRVRRILWLDGVRLRHSARVNGFDEIALIKLDLMSMFKKYTNHLKIAKAYVDEKGNRISEAPPANWASVANLKVDYDLFPIWESKTKEEWLEVAKTGNVPEEMKEYAKRVMEIMNVQKSILSFGPDREATLEYSR